MKEILKAFLILQLIFLVSCTSNTAIEIYESEKVYYEGGPHTDSEGNYYTTVKIGDQIWLKENLNIGRMIQSSEYGFQQTDNDTIEKYCYHNDETYCWMFGGLYQWGEAMQYVTEEGTKGVCPDGWHIPSLNELQILANEVEGSSNALKSIGQGTKNGSGTDLSGFSAFLGGYRNTNGNFYYLTRNTYFWNSSPINYVSSNNMGMIFSTDSIYFDPYSLDCGFCIRCLKDQK